MKLTTFSKGAEFALPALRLLRVSSEYASARASGLPIGPVGRASHRARVGSRGRRLTAEATEQMP